MRWQAPVSTAATNSTLKSLRKAHMAGGDFYCCIRACQVLVTITIYGLATPQSPALAEDLPS